MAAAAPVPAPAAAQAPPGPVPPPPQRLPIGISENNPWLIDPGPVPDGFGPWRDRVAALHPARYRLFVDWSTLQPDPKVPVDLAQPNDGCLRGLPPCGAFAGVRDRLRAVAARQRADGGGWEVVIVLQGVPAWAAAPAGGCERGGTDYRARPITEAGLAGYQALIRGLLALGRQEGVALRWWSPFNEPNHPGFISPQRLRCSVRSRSRSPAVYTRLVRAAQAVLAADPAPHDLVLGELAGYGNPTRRGTRVAEFVDALPDDVACAATVWAQHEYTQPDRRQPDAVGELERALDARPCTRGKPIWVTETGVGRTRAGSARPADPAAQEAQCAAQAALLEHFDADPRVQAVFQFSVREDTAYPVGLFDPRLTRAYPVYDLWKAWGAARPTDPGPPARPAGCSG
ncbi:hypothetical protein NBH00_05805 [Paraconexibacter antarcticus]|uniref:Uncharacterized protein n=1 Tax=Paraconexibacter antarcticus TaxID=2949664 RepID=A0ABY5DW69_9ACTN|nr:hypothetical protein [Paraconexibacter antarcticus]UTI65725.1 hypothetical protein NBH00_05805 [Paraconexibacter antarcticus]